MLFVQCPNCNSHIEIEDVPALGLPIECYHCHVELEIIWLYPVTLDFPERRHSHTQILTVNAESEV